MTSDDYVRGQLVDIAWRSAHHISVSAMATVMFVVRNRVNLDEARNWLGAIRKLDKELSSTITNHAPEDVRDQTFTDLLGYVDAIFDDTKLDKWSLGATHFSDGGPIWFSITGKERVGNVGTLVLYRQT